VVLLDAAPLPRYKACGGGLVQRARREILEVADIPWQGECHTAELHVPMAGLQHKVEREVPILSMVMRADLDWRLVRAAQEAGAELWAPCAAVGARAGGAVHHRGKVIDVATAQGTLTTRFLVIADGAVGTTAAAAGWPVPIRGMPAVEWEIRVPAEVHRRFSGTARFDIGVPEPGYAWVFPKREHLSVGLISMRRGARRLKGQLNAYLAGLGINDILERQGHGGLVPVRTRTPLVRGRVFLVGDAAGLADPLTAEGLSAALVSGRLAGEAIASSELDPWRAQSHYEQAIERDILAELRVARTLARSLYGLPRWRRWFMRRFGDQFTEVMTDLFLGERSYRGTVLAPGNWFRLARYWARQRRS
jgi:flavin-dependent dehydrogenase